jgi:mRNA interferase RelE/StbE
MKWHFSMYSKAKDEGAKLSKSDRVQIYKKIQQVLKNPLPITEGGYGEPLGNKHNMNLTGLNKIKHLGIGKRTIYKLYREDNEMYVLVISARADLDAYKIAEKRLPDAEREREERIDRADNDDNLEL